MASPDNHQNIFVMITWVRMFNKNHYKWESRQKFLHKISFRLFEKSYQKWGNMKKYIISKRLKLFLHTK